MMLYLDLSAIWIGIWWVSEAGDTPLFWRGNMLNSKKG